MNRRLSITILMMVIMLPSKICSADTIYFTNGQTMEGRAEKVPRGVYVDGYLYSNNEIERVEKEALEEKSSWEQKALNLIGIKTNGQKKAEETQKRDEEAEILKDEIRMREAAKVKERLNNNSKMLRAMDRMYDKERQQARSATAATMRKAKRANQEIKSKEKQRKAEFDLKSKQFIENARRTRYDHFEKVGKKKSKASKGAVGSYYDFKLNERTGAVRVIKNTLNKNGSITKKDVSDNPPAGMGFLPLK